MARMLGITFGLVTHVLFGITVWYLFWFLKDGTGTTGGDLGHDALLCLQFAVTHSLILLPSMRRRVNRLIGEEFYGCFFCAATCLSLLTMIACWHRSPVVIWSLNGWGRIVVESAFLLSWPALIYSLSLTGLGYQTGWTTYWHWLRRQPVPHRQFRPRGAYLILRHPVYLSFLGLIWFTPQMTLDHLILTSVWSIYIFVGSVLKDRRLIRYVGDAYREYQAQVPGYPFLPAGPLGRIRSTASVATDAQGR